MFVRACVRVCVCVLVCVCVMCEREMCVCGCVCACVYKIQESLFNVVLCDNLITLAHLDYFPTNKCKATKHKT